MGRHKMVVCVAGAHPLPGPAVAGRPRYAPPRWPGVALRSRVQIPVSNALASMTKGPRTTRRATFFLALLLTRKTVVISL